VFGEDITTAARETAQKKRDAVAEAEIEGQTGEITMPTIE
jgi:hypothetical protein